MTPPRSHPGSVQAYHDYCDAEGNHEEEPMNDGPRIAPAGAIWVCGACGKTSKDRYGDEGSSWDESCMINGVLCHDKKRFDEKGLYCWHTFAEPQQ